MKKASENLEANGMPPEFFSPGSKVRDFYPPHPNAGLAHETPMKPSQIRNRYPPLSAPPRRSLPFRSPSPERHQQHPWHPPRPPGHNYHEYPPRNGSVRRGDGENYHHHHRLRSHMSHGAVHRRPASPPHPQNPHGNHYQDITVQATYSLNIRDPREKALDGLERRDHTGQDSNKGNTVESSPAPEPFPMQRSHSWSPSSGVEQAPVKELGRRASFPVYDSSTSTPHPQNQTHQLTLSGETSHTKDTHPLQQKRRRESGSDDDDGKKRCPQPAGHDGMLAARWLCPTASGLSPHSSTQNQLCGVELSTITSDSHSGTDSPHPPPAVSPAPSPSHCLKSCLKRTSMGAKQACIQSMQNNLVILLSPTKRSELPTDEECKDNCNPRPTQKRVSFHLPNMPNDPRSSSRVHETVDNKVGDTISQRPVVKQSAKPSSCRKLHRNKKTVITDDIQDLFTPDPTTYIVNSGHKTLKVWPDDKAKEITDTSSLSETPDPKVCQEEKTAHVSNVIAKIPDHIKITFPSIILTRCPLPKTWTKRIDKQESVEKEHTEKEATPPRRTSESPLRSDGQSEEEGHEDSLDLDMDLNFDTDMEVGSIRTSDSEDEPLVSLHEIMTKKDSAERGTPSESSPPGHGRHSRHHHTMPSTNTCNYKNSLDQMLKELHASKKAKETETELLTACQEDLLRMAEYEEVESREEPISTEQQQFLQRFSLTSSVIRDIPPGHEVFNLEKFGRIFNQDTLQLRHCDVTPQNTAQKTLLWSSHAQFKPHIHYGLFKEAYDCLPCPFQLTGFLFKMLSVHNDRLLSDEILQVLTDVANTAALQRVSEGNEKFKVWVPSLEDITLVLMNMGAPFVSLFPLESLQPPFTEGDLLEDVCIKSESPSNQEPRSFPEHNCSNIYKYLSYCLFLCPRFYSDSELLLLLTLLCTVSLESRLLLHTRAELFPMLHKLLNNIRHWDDMMPKMCQALTDLTDDHHNMCHLVQLMPLHTRGMKLRQHLSLSMISKLLDGRCLYSPKSKELQLCDLRPYLPRMKPSSLLRTSMGSCQRGHTEGEEDSTPLDQQAYYLCYSLLTLVNGATNYRSFPLHQKEQLLFLCSELERHVKCHIREGEKWLYRSKVKDLVARIYTKWQMMLQKTRPLNGKLYDYWQPLHGDKGSSQDIEEIESCQDVISADDKEDAGDKMEDEEEEEVIEISAEEVANEEPKEEASHEARRLEEVMGDKNGLLDQMDTEDTEEGCIAEQKEKSTLELDSEGCTNTAQDRLCEDMDTDKGSPSVVPAVSGI